MEAELLTMKITSSYSCSDIIFVAVVVLFPSFVNASFYALQTSYLKIMVMSFFCYVVPKMEIAYT